MYTTTWDKAFEPFYINWNRINSAFEDVLRTTKENFPVYNVRKIGDNRIVIELALAGYSKDNLDITEQDGKLIISGALPDNNEEYLYKGIASRKFTKVFSLSEHMVVEGADLVDGILHIGITREIPQEKQPKSIEINKDITPRKERKALNDRLNK